MKKKKKKKSGNVLWYLEKEKESPEKILTNTWVCDSTG